MDPYTLYTCTAHNSSEITHLWNLLGFSRYATLLDIEDKLNDFFLYNKCMFIDSSGALSLRWSIRDGSTIITTPAVFRTWFFTGVQEVKECIPVARPSTPIVEYTDERPKIDEELLEFLLAPSE
jgi:hypothetical protein